MIKETDGMNKAQIIGHLKQQAINGWPGKVGEQRAKDLDKFLTEKLKEYSEVLSVSEEEILIGMEKARTYNAVNYYQEATFPGLKDVVIYDDLADMKKVVGDKGFRCPSCEKVSRNPYTCSLPKCDWKSYGLLGTLGKGHRFTLRDSIPSSVQIDDIFMPVALEAS